MANLSYPAQKKHKVEFGMKHFPFDSLAGFAGENQWDHSRLKNHPGI